MKNVLGKTQQLIDFSEYQLNVQFWQYCVY